MTEEKKHQHQEHQQQKEQVKQNQDEHSRTTARRDNFSDRSFVKDHDSQVNKSEKGTKDHDPGD